MTELMQRLTQARPTDTDLDRLWSPTDRDALHARLTHRPSRTRRHSALLAAAAAVAALAVLPAVLDSGDATAADLHALSLSAASYDGPVLAQGSWLHEKSTSLQKNSPTLSDGVVIDTERESWTGWDGRVLVVEHRPSGGWTAWYTFDDDFKASYQAPTPAFAATLPDTADGLLAYLDYRVFGSSSHAEALYEALTSLATSHTLPPATLAATFDALAQVDHVATTDASVQGRPAIEISYTEDLTSSVDSIVVDRATGQVLTTSDLSKKREYTSTTSLSEVVPEVPADVRADFRTHEHDQPYNAAGQPIDLP